MIDWPELPRAHRIADIYGFWQVQAINAVCSKLTYVNYVNPGKVPLGLGWMVDSISKKIHSQAHASFQAANY